MTHASRTSTRPGFTLVELLVTLGIITLLATILIVAIGRMGVKAREEATVALIRKISNQVQERLEAFERLKSQQQFKNLAISRSLVYVSPSDTESRKQIIGFKILHRELFPQSIEEIRLWNSADYSLLTTTYNPSLATQNDPNRYTESSEALYFFLTRSSVPGIPTVDTGEYKASDVADTDGDGLMEFIDAWGKPLRFYRWPTRLVLPGSASNNEYRIPSTSPIRNQGASVLMNGLPAAASPDPLLQDQDDPTLLAIDLVTEPKLHTPQAHHTFLIMSSGPDGQKLSDADQAFGVFSPADISAPYPRTQPYILYNHTCYGYLAQPIIPTDATEAAKMTEARYDNITNRNRL